MTRAFNCIVDFLGKMSPFLLSLACPSSRFPHTLDIQDYYSFKPTCFPVPAHIPPWVRYFHFSASLQLLMCKMNRAYVFSCGKTKRSGWSKMWGRDKVWLLKESHGAALWALDLPEQQQQWQGEEVTNVVSSTWMLVQNYPLAIHLLLCCGQSEPLLHQTAATAIVES